MNETTVSRRLARLQKTLGTTLFTATDGYADLRRNARRFSATSRKSRGMSGDRSPGKRGARRWGGTCVIATTNSLAEEILAPKSAQLLARDPGLTLQFMTAGQNVNFARWEADLAVRLRKPEKGNFTITKLAEMRLYLFEPERSANAGEEPVICGYPDDLDGSSEIRFSEGGGSQDANPMHNGQSSRDTGADSSHRRSAYCPSTFAAHYWPIGFRATLLPRRLEVWLLVQNHLKRNPALPRRDRLDAWAV